GRRGTNREHAGEGTSKDDGEMCSKQESRQIMDLHYSLVQAMHAKSRSYQALLSDFQNLTEVYDKSRKLHKSDIMKRKDAESQLAVMEEKVRKLQQENEEKERTNRTLNAQLKDARGQVANQLGKINALEADLDEWTNRMDLIKKNLKEQLETLPSENRQQLEFIREPSLYRSHSRAYAERRGMIRVEEREEEEDESVDYDRTEDDMDDDEEAPHTRSGRAFRQSASNLDHHRRSVSAHVLPTKRSRVFNHIEEEVHETGLAPQKKRSRDGINLTSTNTEVTTTITFDEQRPVKAKVAIRRSMNRSMSESNLIEQAARPTGMPMVGTTSTIDLRTPRGAESWTRGRPIDQRPHRFEKMPSFFKMTSCDVCNGGINFAAKPAVRCIDCNQHAHVACKKRLVCPCVPKSATPRTPSRSKMGPRLQEFCPPTAPMIPAPIIHCVIALEKKNLDYPGIYRVPGNKGQVDRVLHELKTSRAVPKLELQDIEVITGCIKEFLRQLRDPLIPKTSRDEFVRAAVADNYTALHAAIRDLPQPNRDTLAFLCLHWLRVVARSTLNKMPMENLVRCLSPTVVGLHNLTSLDRAGDDSNKAMAVLEALLRLDTDYWEQYLSFDGSGAATKSTGSSTLGGTMGTLSLTPKAPPLLSASARINSARGGAPHHLDFSEQSSSAVDQSLLGPISSSPKKGGVAPSVPLIFDNRMRTVGGVQTKKYFPSPL
ncbi:hypothetical protein PFISCL1PPCAC_16805, partial [Pristionchus fissidentatus]